MTTRKIIALEFAVPQLLQAITGPEQERAVIVFSHIRITRSGNRVAFWRPRRPSPQSVLRQDPQILSAIFIQASIGHAQLVSSLALRFALLDLADSAQASSRPSQTVPSLS